MTERSTTILLADDHPVVRAGLRQVLGTLTGLSIVAEAESGEEALYLCSKHRPDIIIMDVKMAGLGGTAATRAIRATYPATKVLALSTDADPQSVSQMVEAGASGFLLKSCSATDLEAAIQNVMTGAIVLDPALANQNQNNTQIETNIIIGGQQRKVLALLVKGFTNPEIAERLGLSLPTARYHVSALLLKLGASNRAEAAALAVRNKLVDASDY